MCLPNVKQLSMGVPMYVQDYDETFPPMTSPAHLQHRVYPYVKNRSVFKCPVTGADYPGNPALNYRTMEWSTSPATMVMLRDAKPHTDVGDKPVWVTGYMDGHVKAMTVEAALGKPAPMPKPLPRSAVIKTQLRELRQMRQRLDLQIRALEREQRQLRH